MDVTSHVELQNCKTHIITQALGCEKKKPTAGGLVVLKKNLLFDSHPGPNYAFIK